MKSEGLLAGDASALEARCVEVGIITKLAHAIRANGQINSPRYQAKSSHVDWPSIVSYIQSRGEESARAEHETVHPEAVPALMKTIANRSALRSVRELIEDRRKEHVSNDNAQAMRR